MAGSTAAATLLTAVWLDQLELDSAKNSKKTAVVAGKEESFGTGRRHLSLTKPSWIVRTEVCNYQFHFRSSPFLPIITPFTANTCILWTVKCTERNKEEARPTL